MILGAWNAACFVTLAGLVAALGAIALASAGRIALALAGLILAGLADLFDGPVARRLERSDYEREFGVQLDTIVDVVSFVVAPVAIAFGAGLHSTTGLGAMLLFAVAGAVRLAHFNTLSARGADQATHHRGLPVTYTALVFPVIFVLRDLLPPATLLTVLGAVFAALAVAFVVDVPVRKPRGALYVLCAAVGALLLVYWLWQGLRF